MASAEVIRNHVEQIKRDLQTAISHLDTLKLEVGTAGDQILSVRARNQNMILAGGYFTNVFPQDVEKLQAQINVHIRGIDSYLAYL